MSDPNQKQPPSTQPIKKTSAVPLRKETVRVTLKAPGAKPGNLPANVKMTKENVTPAPTTTSLPQITTPPAPSAAAAPAPNVPKPSAPAGPPATPLKHETMRVTLKADTTRVSNTPSNPAGVPGGLTPSTSSVAPMVPSASKGPATTPIAPSAPSAPGGLGRPSEVIAPSAPSMGAPTTRSMGAPSAPGALAAPSAPGAPAAPVIPAATIPLGGAAPAAKLASPAPTMNLGTASPTVPLSTPAMGGAGASQPLPQATVQLQQTQPLTQGLGTPTQAAMIQTVGADEDERGGVGALVPLSIVAFVLSLIVLYFQFSHAKIWVNEHKDGDLMTIFEAAE